MDDTAYLDDKWPLPDKEKLASLKKIEQEVAEKLKTTYYQIMAYASYDVSSIGMFIELMETKYDPDNYTVIEEKVEGYLKGHKDKAFSKKLSSLYEAFCAGSSIIEETRGRLVSDGEWGPINDADVSDFLAMVAELPPPINRAHHALPEGLTMFHKFGSSTKPNGSLIRGLLDKGGFSLFYGATGNGKTFLGLDLAARVSTGMAWRDRATSAGGVIYFASEDGAGAKGRMRAWRDRNQIADAPFAIVEQSLDLTTSKGAAALISVTQVWQATTLQSLALIVIDTMARNFGGADENSGQAMGNFVASIDHIRRETGAHVLVISHPGKDLARGSRGHGSLAAAVDTIVRVERGRAVVEKQRDGASGDAFPFRIAPLAIGISADGQPIMSAVIEHEAEAPAAKPAKLDPLPLLAGAVRNAEKAGSPFKMNGVGSLRERRADLPAPLNGMGRDPLQQLAKDAVAAGLIINAGGFLTGAAIH